ncbi:MAG: LPS assembly protein LptD [Pseudomonadota bacterium]
MRFSFLFVLVFCLGPLPGHAQERASLVADRVFIEADSRLVAEGNIEVLYDGQRLTASRITYDQNTGIMDIEGPLTLTDGESAVVLADSGQLDETLQRGILEGARLVLNQRLQLASQQLTRVSGRFTRLSRVVASSCEICETSETPLWEIRASRVVRDEEELQLYFDKAQLRVAGVPIAYIPRLRLPDPTLERARGFLVPSIRTRSQLSTGLRTPYFIPFGDHADVTLTPYVSPRTRTLEFAYRQEVAYGSLEFEGAISDDEIRQGEIRGYLFGSGTFDLPEDFKLSFDIELVSDDSYLFDYGYEDKDRLDSALTFSRVRRDQNLRARAVTYRTLRASEIEREQELPNDILQFNYRQRVARGRAGSLWAGLDAVGIRRDSGEPGVGRDVSRVSAGLDWSTSRTLPFGIVAEASAEAAYDFYDVSQDPDFDDNPTRGRAGAALTLRWPLERTEARGARQILEPIVQLAWADTSGDEVPNEDSVNVELDEGNLFALSRFPGTDNYETGPRLNLGVKWTRYDPTDWSIETTLGRIFRLDDTDQFSTGTGLSGRQSDWLFAVEYQLGGRILVSSRSLIGSDLTLTRSENRFSWFEETYALSGSHIWIAAEPSENRPDDLSELRLDGRYRLNQSWRASSEWRFNAADGETTRAGLGLTWENECVEVGVSLSRRFTSSTTVDPATELDVRVALAGLGTGASQRTARQNCRG